MNPSQTPIPNVLSIAGSDPSGGAGIQADLKTFAALGCYGMAAITALTAQNTRGVTGIHVPPADFVANEIETIFADVRVDAIKIGMLGAADVVAAVSRVLAAHAGPALVVDPVLVATSGAVLGDDSVVAAMWRHLFPLARLITPNLPEAARLAGRDMPTNRMEIEALAAALHARAPTAWLVKGGHGDAESSDDLLFDGQPIWIEAPRVATRNTHGTGCTLSSAIAANLAKGLPLADAVRAGKSFVTRALEASDALRVGHGPGPLNHLA